MSSSIENDRRDQLVETIHGLTLYDMYRSPRSLIPEFSVDLEGKLEESKVSLSISSLKELFRDEFKCPICLDTLDKTWTVSACLHRFCSECLHRSLRTDLGPKMHHECPSCRAKMASRRASKPDNNIDELIVTFLKRGRKVSDDAEPLNTYRSSGNEITMDDIFEYSVDLNDLQQTHTAKVESFKRKSEQMFSEAQRQEFLSKRSRSSSVKENSSSSEIKKETVVNLSLFPWPEWANEGCNEIDATNNPSVISREDISLKKPYLKYQIFEIIINEAIIKSSDNNNNNNNKNDNNKVPAQLRIKDMKQFLKRKYFFSSEQLEVLEVLVHYNDKVMILDDKLTVKDVAINFWNVESEFVLFYRLSYINNDFDNNNSNNNLNTQNDNNNYNNNNDDDN